MRIRMAWKLKLDILFSSQADKEIIKASVNENLIRYLLENAYYLSVEIAIREFYISATLNKHFYNGRNT